MNPREQAEAVALLQRWLTFYDTSTRGLGQPPTLSPRERAKLELLVSQTRRFTDLELPLEAEPGEAP